MTGGETDTQAPAKPAEKKPAEKTAEQSAKVPRRHAQMERLVEAETRESAKTDHG